MKKFMLAVIIAVILTLVIAHSSYAYCLVENPLGGCLIEGF